MEVLEKIDILRKDRGWSINYLAMESELTQSTLNNLYRRNTEPKISTLRSICNAFGISLSEFFKDEDEDNEEDELIKKVKSLSDINKKALLQLLKNIK
ncbi:putative helix-turn-helix protein [Acidiphilium sp. CAG:727]|nr:putative helix-turn-helix protein [Acidiphilium sp. CAG:727]